MFLIKLFSFCLSLLFQYFVAQSVINRTVDNWSLLFWILSIIAFYFSFHFSFKKREKPVPMETSKKTNRKVLFLGGAVIVLAMIVRFYYMSDISRFHGDEYQTAHFSHLLGDFSQLDWFAVYPPKGAWVSQFPLFFFFFQKIFFLIFGTSTLVIRLSVLPYIFLVFLFLFFIAKELFNILTAFFSIILLLFFAPDFYLSSFGLHFISSTALFCIAFYLFIKALKEGGKWQFGLLGFFTALCYLTYYSSYLVLPLFICFVVILVWQKKIELSILKNFFLSLTIFLLTMSPFFVYAFKINNFFLQRFSQVSLFYGSWSQYAKQKLNPEDYLFVFKERLANNIQSLYRDGIGGAGGYDFGHLAFFDKITLLFFCVGMIYLFYRVIKYREFSCLFILIILIVTFITGMVLTTPPPAYHRSSMAFPFIVLCLGVLCEALYQLGRKFLDVKLSYVLVFTILTILLLSNLEHFNQMNKKDKNEIRGNDEYLQIESDIRKQKEKTVFISAFGSYHLGRVLFFRFNGERKFITEYFSILVRLIPKNKTSLLILHYPDEKIITEIKTEFSQVEILEKYQDHLLLKLL